MIICDLNSVNSERAWRTPARDKAARSSVLPRISEHLRRAGLCHGSCPERRELIDERYRGAVANGGDSVPRDVAVLRAWQLGARKKQVLHENTFYTPVFKLGPGDVDESFVELEFPMGHIALRSLVVDVVDENAVSVPLTEVYLHHWFATKFYVKKGHTRLISSVPRTLDVGARDSERIAFQEGADPLAAMGQGLCGDIQDKAFSAGAEYRHTNTTAAALYGFVVRDADAIPEGYEESWILNMHSINTIEAVDRVNMVLLLSQLNGV